MNIIKYVKNLRFVSVLSLFFLFSFLFNTGIIFAKQQPKSDFPKRANYFLSWSMTEAQARDLARWDMLILDMEIQARHPDLLRKIREWNPKIVLLVYITPQEIRQDADISYSKMRAKLFSGINDDWFLVDPLGRRLSWWPETYLLNVTQDAPQKFGKRFNDYIVDFVVDELLSTGLWDGVFYDNAWDNITYFVGTDSVDLNKDGQSDKAPNVSWQDGMKGIYNKTRKRAGSEVIIVGNGNTLVYTNELDGQMFENFHNFDWSKTMNTYKTAVNQNGGFSIINANTNNTGDSENYKSVRFGLASSLLEDGYYSYDFGDKSHGQLWWYDGYSVDLGRSRGTAVSNSGSQTYVPDIWRRNFDRGAVIVNSTESSSNVVLGGEFEKIHGTQDIIVNDGSIVSETFVPANDGLILLKTFEKLEDVVFRNGDFVRFLKPDGSRVRNGFFVSESEYSGGDMIIRTDINGNEKKDLVLVQGNKISVWRNDGQIYMQAYPYTVNYKGALMVAVGDIDSDGKKEIVVAPTQGSGVPIKIYSYDGILKKNPWYPFGPRYTGGYSIAITQGLDPHIIIGAGIGVNPEVYVFDNNLNYVRSWFAYETGFKGGVSVGSGDINGDGIDEIITGPLSKKLPIIKVFNPFGALLYKQFTAFTSLVPSAVEIQTADVDFDGIDDILIFSSGI